MPFFLALKKLVGANEQQEHESINIDRTKQVEEFYDSRGVSQSRYRLQRKIGNLQKSLKNLKDRKTRYLASVKEKRAKVAVAKKKTSAKQRNLDNALAKAATAKAELDAAKHAEHEAKQLAKILYPELRPARDASLSPKSKEMKLAAEFFDDAALVEKDLEENRQAKRKSSASADEPASKKRKMSAEDKEQLEPHLFAKFVLNFHSDASGDDHGTPVADVEDDNAAGDNTAGGSVAADTDALGDDANNEDEEVEA